MRLLGLMGLFGAGLLLGQTDPLLEWMDQTAQRQLDEREAAVAAIRDRAGAEQRRQVVKAKLLAILGGLPEYAGPLRARVTGTIPAAGYTIEQVIFESLPGLLVTGNVYRPTAAGRYPGVLIPVGHTQEGKPEAQRLAANLALQGFVAFAYDPIGQGEREQTYLPQLGRAFSGGGGNEHIELGPRSLLLGQSVARYFIQDARRALDYLASRRDVDAERLGVTGCSGGGCIATYLAALDPRIKAAAPGCFINTFRQLFTGPTADSEMSLPGFLAEGLDLADLFELPAPLPWLMLATTEDYFTPAGARPVFDETRRFYGHYGAAERVEFFVGKGPHGTPVESREAIYRFLTRWLKGGREAPKDRSVKLYTNRELRVTRTGNVAGEAGSRKVYEVIAEEMRMRLEPRGQAALVAELRRLGVPSAGAMPAVEMVEETKESGFRRQRIRFESEGGLTLAATLYLPDAPGRRTAVVVVEEKRLPVPLFVQRSQSTAGVAEAMVRAGSVVLELEPRDSPSSVDGRPFLGNWLANERADLVGRNLAAMRAHDILRGVDLLAGRSDVNPAAIRGYARGVKGFWLGMAAAVDPRLTRIWVDRMPWSLRAAFAAPMTNNLFEAMIPGFALHWDFGDLWRAMGPRRVMRTDPTDWMWRVVEAGPWFRYRVVGEGDGAFVEDFLR
ncbi:MAG: acetylxylan esterase [Acidobacteria bacterium]|nr:acetylxylan esterase [Acidobacteriota bacterium]